MGWDVALIGELSVAKSKQVAWKRASLAAEKGPTGFPPTWPSAPTTVKQLLAALDALPARRITFGARSIAVRALLPKEDYETLAAPIASACRAAASLGASGELRLVGWITAPPGIGYALTADAARGAVGIRALSVAERKATRALPAYEEIDALVRGDEEPSAGAARRDPKPPKSRTPATAVAPEAALAKLPKSLRAPLAHALATLLSTADPSLDAALKKTGPLFASIGGRHKDTLRSAKELRRVASKPSYDDPAQLFAYALRLLAIVAPDAAEASACAIFEAANARLPLAISIAAAEHALRTPAAPRVPRWMVVNENPFKGKRTDLVRALADAPLVTTPDLVAGFDTGYPNDDDDVRRAACVCAAAALLREDDEAFAARVGGLVRADYYGLLPLLDFAIALAIPLVGPAIDLSTCDRARVAREIWLRIRTDTNALCDEVLTILASTSGDASVRARQTEIATGLVHAFEKALLADGRFAPNAPDLHAVLAREPRWRDVYARLRELDLLGQNAEYVKGVLANAASVGA